MSLDYLGNLTSEASTKNHSPWSFGVKDPHLLVGELPGSGRLGTTLQLFLEQTEIYPRPHQKMHRPGHLCLPAHS
jgi:hypothetical protein